MKKLNKVIVMCAIVLLSVTFVCACKNSVEDTISTEKEDSKVEETEKINVVATIFPEYDFLRQIGGDNINLSMLLKPGAESHSFEPTPQDIKNIKESDLFVYVGGDSDAWVQTILDSLNKDNSEMISLMDCVNLVEEDVVEGMTEEQEDETKDGVEEIEYDEHVWTSPQNAILIVQQLCDRLCQIDEEHADQYKENTRIYIGKLEELDQDFQEVVDHSVRKEIVVGDRFPFRYFADEYGLTYYAAFPGCSTDTEASASTIAFLDDLVKKDHIPVVFHIELSNEKVCNAICESTGSKSELLHAVHNISKDDFDAGVTYLDLMKQNVLALKEALN